jgi:hypothetical protein
MTLATMAHQFRESPLPCGDIPGLTGHAPAAGFSTSLKLADSCRRHGVFAPGAPTRRGNKLLYL